MIGGKKHGRKSRNAEANGNFPDFMVNLSCCRREIPTFVDKGSEYFVHFKASSHGRPDKTPKKPCCTVRPWLKDAESGALDDICSHHHLCSIWMQRLTLATNPHNPRVRNVREIQSWGPLPDTAAEK